MLYKSNMLLFIWLHFLAILNNNDATIINSMSGKIPPGNSYREISVELAVMHIYDINMDHQTVRLSGYFRQSWNDSRMMGDHYDTVGRDGRKFYLMNKADAIWYPDTFISNSLDHQDRQSFSGDPQGAYHYFRVYTDGEVFYSQMIELKVKTRMNLKYYPFNVLNIELDIESYGYVDDTLKYAIGISNRNKFENTSLELEMKSVPGYIVNNNLSKNFLTRASYSPGYFSKIEMLFHLIPNDSTLFILSIPNLLLIIISSFVFWMDVKKKLSERLSLGITAMLADFALSFSLPVPNTPDSMYVREYINISYIFIGFSIFFTFMEYIIVSFFYNIKTEIMDNTSENKEINKKYKYKGIISKTVQNLKASFMKLLDMNELLRHSLIEYMNNSLPEEPVMPIKSALGVFYLLCWVSFMTAHIIPGKLIIKKAREGIEYHEEAIKYFPIIISVGISISLIFAILAFYIQYKSRNKWTEKMDKRDKLISKYIPAIETKIISGKDVTCSLDENSISKISSNNDKKPYIYDDYNMNKLDDQIKSLGAEINNNFEEISQCINTNLDIADDINTSIENNSDDDSNIIITVIESKVE